MPEVSEDMFTEAVRQVVRDNLSFLPPYGTGGALYIRFIDISIKFIQLQQLCVLINLKACLIWLWASRRAAAVR